MKNRKIWIGVSGLIIGIMSGLLVKFGNPGNMGICIACFIRDLSGAMGLHKASQLAYIRPEIIGIVLGAFGAALVSKEFSAKVALHPLQDFF